MQTPHFQTDDIYFAIVALVVFALGLWLYVKGIRPCAICGGFGRTPYGKCPVCAGKGYL